MLYKYLIINKIKIKKELVSNSYNSIFKNKVNIFLFDYKTHIII